MNNKTIARNPGLQDESLTELLQRLGEDSASLVRQELTLARQEFLEKMQGLVYGVVMVSLGAVIGLVAFVTIVAAFIIWLTTNYLSPAVATVITGGGLAVIGAVIIFYGISLFRQTTAKPIKTVEALQGRTENG